MKLFSPYPLLLLAALTTACGQMETPIQPQEIKPGTACSLDGMILADFPGPKGQIHYASGKPDFFCDTMEMFAIYLQPEEQKLVTGIFTQDMGNTDWDKPEDNWIDARLAYFVLGSSRAGSMGPTLASFADLKAAEGFAQQYGGKVLRFDEVTIEISDLTGGADHSGHM